MIFTRIKNLARLTSLYICQLIRSIEGGEFIHVIGDSHALSFQDCRLKVHYLGAITAYNLINENSTSKGRIKLFQIIDSLKSGDQVLLVFGEIDCRIHIYNQYRKKKKKVSLEKLIDDVALNYSQVIDEIRRKGILVSIYNIVPPGPQENIYKYPFYPDWKTRLWITQRMNEKLRELCKNKKILFVDIFNQVINPRYTSEKNFRVAEYVFDDVHLRDKVTKLVIDKFK